MVWGGVISHPRPPGRACRDLESCGNHLSVASSEASGLHHGTSVKVRYRAFIGAAQGLAQLTAGPAAGLGSPLHFNPFQRVSFSHSAETLSMDDKNLSSKLGHFWVWKGHC